MVDVPALVEQVEHRGFVEDSVAPTDTTDTFNITVLESRPKIQFTLVWDDQPGDTSTAETTSKLVNDLDLVLVDPDGTEYHPWVLDPLTANANPGSGGFDPVTRANITPAYRGVDRRNTVEQVSVTDTVGVMTGTWTVRVTAHNLPNNNTQPYSLIGDFRELQIVGAQTLVSTGFPANAGSTADPDKMLIRVKIENPHVSPGYTENYTTTDFLVQVGDAGGGSWSAAQVLSVFQVGGEVAIDVRPPAGLSAGSFYDLRVTLIGISRDTRTNAFYFVQGDQVAGYFLTDTSGSMKNGKIAAAIEAGKALVDLLRTDDWVGVGHFSTQAQHLMNVTQVAGDAQLNAAKGHIDGFTASGSTAMGPGMQRAREELDDASLPEDTQKVVFVLSDAMENTVEPPGSSPPDVGCWDNHDHWDCKDNPPYVKTTWPEDIQAYLVCLGEAGAAWHDYCDQVAADTTGPPAWHVYETPATPPSTHVAGPVPALLGGEGWAGANSILDYPTTLEVRLDDAYLDMGQKSHRWPRMLEWTGWISPQLEYVDVPLDMERVPAIYVTLEWDDPNAAVQGQLLRPDGMPVEPSDGDVIYYRSDATHIHWGLGEPEGGSWTVRMIATEKLAEALVTASGPSDISMRLLIDPDTQFVYDEIEVCALLTDNQPIPASAPALVLANVIDPAGSSVWMWLYDDGRHEDGAANNGVFCARYTGVDQGGVYQIKAVGEGSANDGRQFTRRAMGHAYRRPKLAYLLRDEDTARDYVELFNANQIKVDLIGVDELTIDSHDLSKYALIIIGPRTGEVEDWGTDEALTALIEAGRPTLGLGRGGYAFFGKLELYMGYPNGRYGQEIGAYAADMGHIIWLTPHDLKLEKPEVELYSDTTHVGIPFEPISTVEYLGRELRDDSHYSIVREATYRYNDRAWHHALWGYDAGPSLMTAQGRRLLFNVAWYMLR
jgi:hypothetical protein